MIKDFVPLLPLCDDNVYDIFSYCNYDVLLRLESCCHWFQEVSRREEFWEAISKQLKKSPSTFGINMAVPTFASPFRETVGEFLKRDHVVQIEQRKQEKFNRRADSNVLSFLINSEAAAVITKRIFQFPYKGLLMLCCSTEDVTDFVHCPLLCNEEMEELVESFKIYLTHLSFCDWKGCVKEWKSNGVSSCRDSYGFGCYCPCCERNNCHDCNCTCLGFEFPERPRCYNNCNISDYCEGLREMVKQFFSQIFCNACKESPNACQECLDSTGDTCDEICPQPPECYCDDGCCNCYDPETCWSDMCDGDQEREGFFWIGYGIVSLVLFIIFLLSSVTLIVFSILGISLNEVSADIFKFYSFIPAIVLVLAFIVLSVLLLIVPIVTGQGNFHTDWEFSIFSVSYNIFFIIFLVIEIPLQACVFLGFFSVNYPAIIVPFVFNFIFNLLMFMFSIIYDDRDSGDDENKGFSSSILDFLIFLNTALMAVVFIAYSIIQMFHNGVEYYYFLIVAVAYIFMHVICYCWCFGLKKVYLVGSN